MAKVGRPSAYDPKYCELLVEEMAKGRSIEAVAGIIGVSKQTIYSWTENFPEFLDAKRIGETKSQLFWEDIGQRGIWTDKEGPFLNTSNWIFQMKNRFKWKDKHEIETIPTQQESEIEKIKKLSDKELKALIKERLEEKDEI